MFGNIFGNKRRSEDEDDYEERPERKKPMFGFACSPSIHVSAKALAKKLHVDLYVIAEHAIQLGLMDISAAMEDPEELEVLREHLHEAHAITHLVESVSKYDQEAAQYIRDGQSRRHHKELAVWDLVELWARYNLDPRLMRGIILQELQRRTAAMRSRTTQKE